MLNKKFNYREVKKFDVWYCKDRRILIYLGKNSGDVQSEGQYVWVLGSGGHIILPNGMLTQIM